MKILISCIGRRGYLAHWFRASGTDITVLGTSNSHWTAGFADCDASHLLPGIDSPNYIDEVVDLCRAHRVDALLSVFDRDIDVLSSASERLRAIGTTPIIPSADSSMMCLDKLATANFLEARGIPCVPTFGDETALRRALASGRLRYPIVAKDRFGYGSLGVQKITNEARLDFELSQSQPGSMVFQPLAAGLEFSLDLLNDLSGEPNVVSAKRKIRMRAGETDQAETVRDDTLTELGVEIARALAVPGAIDVDIFVDGDNVQVLEINPRFGGGYPCTHLAGGDFPGRIVEMLRGGLPSPAIGTLPAGVRMLKALRFVSGGPAPAASPDGY